MSHTFTTEECCVYDKTIDDDITICEKEGIDI